MQAASLSAVAVVSCALAAHAQTVEFRIVERTSQTQATLLDPVLDLAVQARFNGANSLGGFYFDIRILGEQESRGSLARGGITNLDGTYDPTINTGTVVGRHGLARQYSYVATVNPNFNGLINTSSATFTNTAEQEIGLITAYAQSSPMLQTPGIDVDQDGNPDTWSGNGSGITPPNLATASMPAAVATTYFGNNQFIDVYRFRYTVTDFAARTLQFRVTGVAAEQFIQLVFSSGQWSVQNSTVSSTAIVSSGVNISVIPAPGAACLLGIGALTLTRRRRG